ncbi:MAG: hypothetical protein ACRDRX_00150 [Pseudonocardiaceae bacterium]
MSEPTVVYLVENHTDPEPATHTKYWAHVYLSRDKAEAGVKHWAERGGHGAVRWEEHSSVFCAYAAGSAQQRELYRVVPLRVHRDDQSEP